MVTAKAGQIAVAGNFEFDIQGRMGFAPSAADFIKEADSYQVHYAKAFDPEMESRTGTSATKFYRAILEQAHTDADAKRRLLADADADIGSQGWKAHIDRSRQ